MTYKKVNTMSKTSITSAHDLVKENFPELPQTSSRKLAKLIVKVLDQNLTIYRASYESRSFNFEAYGKTKTDALKTIAAALNKHTIQFNCDPDWFDHDSINVVAYTLNTPYRDYEVIK